MLTPIVENGQTLQEIGMGQWFAAWLQGIPK
jgi:hypothetical protein